MENRRFILLLCLQVYLMGTEAFYYTGIPQMTDHVMDTSFFEDMDGGLQDQIEDLEDEIKNLNEAIKAKDKEIQKKDRMISDRDQRLKNVLKSCEGFGLNMPSWMAWLPNEIKDSAWRYAQDCIKHFPVAKDSVNVMSDWTNLLEFFNVQLTRAEDEYNRAHGGTFYNFNPKWGFVPGRFLKEYTSVIPFPKVENETGKYFESQKWLVTYILFDVCKEFNENEDKLVGELSEVSDHLRREDIERFFELMQSDYYINAFSQGEVVCLDPGIMAYGERDVIEDIKDFAETKTSPRIRCSKPVYAVYASYGAAQKAAPQSNQMQSNPPTHQPSRMGSPPYMSGGNSMPPPRG